ncbi:hypothetical protein JCM10908_005895 [Rhodotorula pacifica]|uniref:tRNA (carboxymethyluridine(34)-5-O)-methyltransferase n=1 Tax=Rhodotorula pacifica TaxID=1495444 RepID=UPI00317EFC45
MTDATLAAFESVHVHAVYNEIASDFSRTRHSRWPFVQHFLDALPAGSLVLDAGTGNGKYLGVRSVLEWEGKYEPEGKPTNSNKVHHNKGKGKAVEHDEADTPRRADMLPIGFDMSIGLLGIASQRGHEVVRGDCVDLSCWRRGAFDHAISIATIHHFATPERRVESIKQMILAVLPPSPPLASSSSSSSKPARPQPSRILIVVWSLEQDPALISDDRSARRKKGGKKGAVPAPLPLPVSVPAAGEGASPHILQDKEDIREEEDQEQEQEGEEGVQDVFVPWARQNQVPRAARNINNSATSAAPAASSSRPHPSVTTAAVVDAPSPTSASDNPSSTSSSAAVPPAASSTSAPPSASPPPRARPQLEEGEATPTTTPTFNRYYHLFKHFELSSLVQSAAAQLGLAFHHPEGYPLAHPASSTTSTPTTAGEERDGWYATVRLCEERWERENWVVEVEVGWVQRRRDDGGGAQ